MNNNVNRVGMIFLNRQKLLTGMHPFKNHHNKVSQVPYLERDNTKLFQLGPQDRRHRPQWCYHHTSWNNKTSTIDGKRYTLYSGAEITPLVRQNDKTLNTTMNSLSIANTTITLTHSASIAKP